MIFRLLLFWLSTSFFKITRNICFTSATTSLSVLSFSAKETKLDKNLTWCLRKEEVITTLSRDSLFLPTHQKLDLN